MYDKNGLSRLTIAIWLYRHGRSSSSELRKKAGVTAKQTPISSLLDGMTLGPMRIAEKFNRDGGNEFELNQRGVDWVKANLHKEQPIDFINSRTFSKGKDITDKKGTKNKNKKQSSFPIPAAETTHEPVQGELVPQSSEVVINRKKQQEMAALGPIWDRADRGDDFAKSNLLAAIDHLILSGDIIPGEKVTIETPTKSANITYELI